MSANRKRMTWIAAVVVVLALVPVVAGSFTVSLLNDIGIGALAVGVVESFASFWSGALKDVIVFSLLIPVLMLRSFMSVHSEEEEDEVDQ